MRKLNTSAAVLEVMGAPLTGTDLRAYVMSGGGPRLKNFKLRLGGKRCFLIYPVQGSERRGLVSVEAKKKKGQVRSQIVFTLKEKFYLNAEFVFVKHNILLRIEYKLN